MLDKLDEGVRIADRDFDAEARTTRVVEFIEQVVADTTGNRT